MIAFRFSTVADFKSNPILSIPVIPAGQSNGSMSRLNRSLKPVLIITIRFHAVACVHAGWTC